MASSTSRNSSTRLHVQNVSEMSAKQLYHAYNIFEASPSLLEEEFIYGFDGPFEEYPRTCGLDTIKWPEKRASSGSHRELAIFAERWLIHGLLRTYIGPACRSVPRSACTLEDGSIQFYYSTQQMTAWLVDEVASWQYLLASKPKEIIRTKYETAWNCYEVSQKVFRQLFLSSEISISDPTGRDLRSQFLFIFQLVGEHLGHALWQFPTQLSFIRHINAQARKSNWSERDRRKLHASLDEELIETLGYIPLQISKDWGRNRGIEELFVTRELDFLLETTKHSVSTLQRCALTLRPAHASRIGSGLEANVDQPRHLNQDCTCNSVGPDIDIVKRIIRNGKLPLLRWKRDGAVDGAVTFEVIEHKPNTRYIAISHVWSDGRGNEAENSLPACQLQDMFTSSLWDGEFPIWMDTLCIPVDDEILRKEAIKNMNKIYYEAHRVVVISNDLRSRPYTDTIDDWLAFRTSAWMRRMWTLQEGVFGGPQLWVCFKDCIKNFVPEIEKYRFFDYLSPVYQFADSTITIFGDIDRLIQRRRLSELISHILAEFKWRQTKNRVDEPIVFAALLGLNPEVLLSRDRSSEAKKRDKGKGKGRALGLPRDSKDEQEFLERMDMLYSRISEFPADILWRLIPRMQKAGRRWAPYSLHIPDWTPEIGSDTIASPEMELLSSTKGEVLHRGLRVEVWVTAVEHPDLKRGFPSKMLLNIPNTCPQCATTRPFLRYRVQTKQPSDATEEISEPIIAGTCRFAILQRRVFGARKRDPDWYADAAIIEVEEGFETFKGFFTPPYKGPGAWWGFKDFVTGRQPGITGRYLGPAAVYAIDDDDVEDTLDSYHDHNGTTPDAAYERDLSEAIAASLRESQGKEKQKSRPEIVGYSAESPHRYERDSPAAGPSSSMANRDPQIQPTTESDIHISSLSIRDILDNIATTKPQDPDIQSSATSQDGDNDRLLELVGIRPGKPFPVIVT